MDIKSAGNDIIEKMNPKRILGIVVVVLTAGTVFYHFTEDWSWIDSFYFCVVTLATVGYGDLTPQTDLGKLFTTFYILIGVGILAGGVGYLLRYEASRRWAHRQSQEPKNLNEKRKA